MIGGLVEAALQMLSGHVGRDHEAEARAQQQEAERFLEPMARGWRHWSGYYIGPPMSETPYDYEKVWIWRREWEMPAIVVPRGLDPQMNVAGLWWKPWRESDAGDTETRLLTTGNGSPHKT